LKNSWKPDFTDIDTDVTRASASGFKGTNMPGVWWQSDSLGAYSAVKSNGFNSVRIVWETKGSAADLSNHISTAKNAGLSVMVELHDVTGSDSTSDLSRMADYWCQSDVKDVLSSNSDIMVNIANEWGSNNLSDSTWYDAYKSAIQKMRNAGIKNTIVVDASGWGQNESPIINYGKSIMSVDSNVILDLHMYGSWNDPAKIRDKLSEIKSLGLPLMVGEFGYNYNNGGNNLSCQVDAATVMSACSSNGFGYLAWSWCGNNSENAWLDMTDDWKTLNSWGSLVKSGGSSSATSPPSTTSAPGLTDAPTSPPSSGGSGGDCGTCNWYGTNYPMCCTDVGGWGWENNQSCISQSTCDSQNGGSTSTTAATSGPASTPVPTSAPLITDAPTSPPAPTNTPSSSGSCGTCNWYGTNYPICCNTTSGWGWENNQSCISQSTCDSQNGGSTTTTAPTSPPSSTSAPTEAPSSGGSTCSSGTPISSGFTKDGEGEFCFEASSVDNYISSWNLDELTVNGVDFTNKYANVSNLPAKTDGKYYIYYKCSVSWGHFELK
jgi:mannan endo-1,4-beta-mannosidase